MNCDLPENQTKYVIIGAGPAGLTAGLCLLRQRPGADVLILEESAFAGGISRTVRYGKTRMDLGGHRFFTKDLEVEKMWHDILPMQGAPAKDDRITGRMPPLAKDGPDPEKTDRVMLSRRRISRIFSGGHFFDYPVRLNMNTLRSMGVLQMFSAGWSYLCSCFRKLPETSLENFYINRFGRKLYSVFFEGYTEKLWGKHPRDISADWGAQRVKGLSIAAVLKDVFLKKIPFLRRGKKVETSLIEEFMYPKFGPGHFWETAAEEFRKAGGKIRFNCKVLKLTVRDSAIREVLFRSEHGAEESVPADCVLSSMPLKDLAAGMNGVPPETAAVAAGLEYRDFVTVGLLLDKLNLKNETKLKTLNNILPDCWIYVQDSAVRLGRIQIFNNWSPYMLENPEKQIAVGLEYFCTEGGPEWNRTPEAWKDFAVSELVRMNVLAPHSEICDYHVEKVPKAYPAYFGTYARINELIRYLNGIRNLYCIGRNGQHRYNNMDHSMATAFAAVRNILNNGWQDKSAIWKVNTEKEYHETKT